MGRVYRQNIFSLLLSEIKEFPLSVSACVRRNETRWCSIHTHTHTEKKKQAENSGEAFVSIGKATTARGPIPSRDFLWDRAPDARGTTGRASSIVCAFFFGMSSVSRVDRFVSTCASICCILLFSERFDPQRSA